MVVEAVGAIASLKAALEFARAIKASTDAIDNAQIKLQVAELISALADAKMEAADNAELISSLQLQLKAKSEMQFDGSVYYRVKKSGDKEGPWCATCFDARGLEIRLQRDNSASLNSNWHCKECKGFFR